MTRILIVDDSQMARRNASRILTGVGYDVVKAGGREAGLAALQAERADVVLLDLLIPGVNDETELVGEFCALAADAPVVVVSSNIQAKVQEAVIQAGAANFLAKPYDATELLAVVRAVLGA